MKSLLPVVASLILLLSVSNASIAASYQEQKVVYHMNYGDSHRIAETMINISNHLSEVGDERVDIKVVVHGKAIEYFLAAAEDEAKQMTLDSLRLRDVQFYYLWQLTGWLQGHSRRSLRSGRGRRC